MLKADDENTPAVEKSSADENDKNASGVEITSADESIAIEENLSGESILADQSTRPF